MTAGGLGPWWSRGGPNQGREEEKDGEGGGGRLIGANEQSKRQVPTPHTRPGPCRLKTHRDHRVTFSSLPAVCLCEEFSAKIQFTSRDNCFSPYFYSKHCFNTLMPHVFIPLVQGEPVTVPSISPPRSGRWAGRSSAPPWGGGRAAAGCRPAGSGSARTDAPPGSPPRRPLSRGGGTGRPHGTAPGSWRCSAPMDAQTQRWLIKLLQ